MDVPLCHATEHGVGEPRRPRRDAAHELNPLAHADRVGRVEVEQLVRGEPEGVPHAWLELGSPREVRVYHPVELSRGSHAAHDKSRDQRAVPLVERHHGIRAPEELPCACAPAASLRDNRKRGLPSGGETHGCPRTPAFALGH